MLRVYLTPDAPMSREPAALLRLVTTTGLPEPVQRYFRFVRVADGDTVHPVRLIQRGEFRLGDRKSRWYPFRATHLINPIGPGFHWEARVRLFPGLGIRVRDSYHRGIGRVEAHLAGIIPLARLEDNTRLAVGELHRYLAEAVWNPAALLPGSGVEWKPIDRDSARATLTAHGHTVSLDFLFDAEGRALQSYTHARYRSIDDAMVLTPWLCEYRDYVPWNGVMIPREGEVSWLLPDGQLSYCRLEIAEIQLR